MKFVYVPKQIGLRVILENKFLGNYGYELVLFPPKLDNFRWWNLFFYTKKVTKNQMELT